MGRRTKAILGSVTTLAVIALLIALIITYPLFAAIVMGTGIAAGFVAIVYAFWWDYCG
jgi:Flp pilus assembly protein protease CpaA